MRSSLKLILILSLTVFGCESTKDDSSITEFGKVFVSSNTDAKIGIFDFSDSLNITSVEFLTTIDDADGIYYDRNRDLLYQADREHNRINAFSKLSNNKVGSSILPSAISTSDFLNPRGLTSENNIAIVAQDASDANGQQNAFFVYDVGANAITLRNEFNVNFPVWDIQLVGNTLYAVQDESDSIAIFNNFFGLENGIIVPDFKIRIENLDRAHGFYYSLDEDLMILTDVDDVSDTELDGEIRIIEDFNIKVSATLQTIDKTIFKEDQIKISGPNTMLRNPVDVVYHRASNRIIVAERTTNEGMLLSFPRPTLSGDTLLNISPTFMVNYPGASGLFINQDNR